MLQKTRIVLTLALVTGVCMPIGCSDDSTAPVNDPPASTALKALWSQRFGDVDVDLGRGIA